MTRTTTLLAAATLLPLLGAGPAGAYAPARGEVLVLVAAGYPVSTSFATDPARRYTITVTGQYEYDGINGLGFSDCGHKDPEQNAGGWINVANVGLDNKVAYCSVMAWDQTHTYTWEQSGTGAPFTFVIFANTYTTDDYGCLLVRVTDAAATPPAGLPGPAPDVPRACLRTS